MSELSYDTTRARLMDAMGFRFKIGDVVRHKYADKEQVRNYGRGDTTSFIVLSRISEECSGGVQLMYRVRAVFGQGGLDANTVSLNECELAEVEE